MTKRIFRSIFAVALLVFLASVILFLGMIYQYFSDVQHKQLKMQTELVAQGLENEGISYFDDLEVDGYRITWIGSDGTVLYDSSSDTSEMDNHLEREEVKEAIAEGYGESTRYSTTMMERLLYCAQLLPDGTVIRLSIVQSSVLMLIIGMAQPLAILVILAVGLSFFLASRLAKRIVNPLNNLDLDHPEFDDEYEEIQPLLQKISHQQKKIKSQKEQLHRKKQEFETVTSYMNEGIILLNKEGKILSVNQAAKRLFQITGLYLEKDIFTINHSIAFQNLIRNALQGTASEQKMHLGTGEYQLNSSPVFYHEEISGIVLLAFDITEKEKAEQMRREFTANVSHELKTPLQSISGYSELLKSNMVKPEDVPKFSENIYVEAQRLINLVEDIIKLSHLDEGAEGMQKEEVNLLEMAGEVVSSLQKKAKAEEVVMDVLGDSAVVVGIPQLLHSIVYNLCDNAIKYNQRGGSVTVQVKKKENSVQLSVSDTGIGIPQELQERIFERFYRVDKSHSKALGGTGLGLSIVKHAASLHHAQISVESIMEAGTTITVTFPEE